MAQRGCLPGILVMWVTCGCVHAFDETSLESSLPDVDKSCEARLRKISTMRVCVGKKRGWFFNGLCARDVTHVAGMFPYRRQIQGEIRSSSRYSFRVIDSRRDSSITTSRSPRINIAPAVLRKRTRKSMERKIKALFRYVARYAGMRSATPRCNIRLFHGECLLHGIVYMIYTLLWRPLR